MRLLTFDFEWSRAQKKGKLPTTLLDKKVGEVLERIFSDREEAYGQTIQVSQRPLTGRMVYTGMLMIERMT